MRILHAAETVQGGVATVLNDLTSSQANCYGETEIAVLVPFNQRLHIENSKITFYYDRSGRNIRSFFYFAIAFFKLVKAHRPDIVHLHSSFAGLIGRIIIAICFNDKKPFVVYTPHAFSFLMETSPFRRKFYSALERVASHFCDAIICVSKHEQENAIEAGLPESKLFLVYNGVGEPTTNDAFLSPFKEDVINLIFVGRFDYQKGLDVLLHAMQHISNGQIELTVIGSGALQSPDLTNQSSNIRFLGWKRGAELVPFFRYADAVVVPSRWEGFAMVPLEAMREGTCVISSDASSLPEAVCDGINGLVFPCGDSTALASLLNELNIDRLRSLGAAGKVIWKQRFSSEIMNLATLDIYRNAKSPI